MRLWSTYAVVMLLPVLVLGGVLAVTFRSEENSRGLAQGQSEATLIAQTAIEPLLDGRPLRAGLSPRERAGMERLVHRAVAERHVLRLRLRDLTGRVVFSDDGTGFNSRPDDDALDAAGGQPVAHITKLNADLDDDANLGARSVEVYLPLSAGMRSRPVGVLEIYLPYAPIANDVNGGFHHLYVNLAVGLLVLYLVLLGIAVSVSRGLRREAAINAFLAHHDALTELPNRTLFLTRAKEAVERGSQSNERTAIAIIDLDRFKDINDTLGHQSGDHLLTELARRISASMRPGDTVARLGGDEFGVILASVADPEQALWRLREVITREIEVRGLPLSVEPSIGYVTVPELQADVDVLLQHADVAMYAAKAQHAGVLQYRSELDHYDARNLGLAAELRAAIGADQLVLHYQPQSDATSEEVVAVEALVRWQHPTQGLLYPNRFLPLAEQTDVIDELTDWVLVKALSDVKQLSVAGRELSVAVNASARSIVRVDFARRVVKVLSDLGVAPERLIIEVTETALLADPARAAAVLDELARAGVKVSLDDFGRGQTSLSYLSSLPIHELKIDRSFVTDMQDNHAHAAIVQSLIELGHNLAMRVVAEGIETESVLTMLQKCDCDLVQGFHLAKPMPVGRLAEWLSGAELTPAS